MRILIALAVAIVAVGFLGYTKPGHSVLASIGLVAACGGGSSDC